MVDQKYLDISHKDVNCWSNLDVAFFKKDALKTNIPVNYGGKSKKWSERKKMFLMRIFVMKKNQRYISDVCKLN